MRVWVVTETNEHDEYDPTTDGKEVIGVFKDKIDAIVFVGEQYEDEQIGRDLNKDDGWVDHNGGFLRDDEDKLEMAWTIEPYEVR